MPMVGEETDEGAETEPSASGKSRTTTALLAIFTGWFGGHKFYLGQWSSGVTYLFLFWTTIPFFLSVIQGVKMLGMSDAKFRGEFLGESGNEETDYILKARGNNGQVELHETKVRVLRNGLLAKLNNPGETQIPIDQISAVKLKTPGMVTTGFIQFATSGQGLDSGAFDAADEANAVNFGRGKTDQFKAIRDKVDELRQGGGTDDSDEAVERLRERFADGEISKEEFEERKAILEGD